MNKAKKEPFTKFKKCLFLVVFLLSLNNLKSQDFEKVKYLYYQIKCNNFNALYYEKENELTIQYDTTKYSGEIVLDFDTTFFKIIKRVDKFKYRFFISKINGYSVNNELLKLNLPIYYIENGEKFTLVDKQFLCLDTNTWFAKFDLDYYIEKIGVVPYTKLLLLAKEGRNLVYFVKNDQVVLGYRSLCYCISGIDNFENNYAKLCVKDLNSANSHDLFRFIQRLSNAVPIYIENITVQDLKGKSMVFPPISFKLVFY